MSKDNSLRFPILSKFCELTSQVSIAMQRYSYRSLHLQNNYADQANVRNNDKTETVYR